MRAYPSFPGALFLVFAFLLLSGVVGFGLGLLWTALPYPVSPQLSGAIGNTIITAVLLALIFRYKQSPRPVLAALRRFPRAAAVVTGMVLATVGLHIIASELTNLVRFVIPIPESIRELLSQLTGKQNLGASLLLLVIVAPVTEELLLRGVVLDGFLRNYRRTTAVLLSALVFGLMHANPWQFVGGARLREELDGFVRALPPVVGDRERVGLVGGVPSGRVHHGDVLLPVDSLDDLLAVEQREVPVEEHHPEDVVEAVLADDVAEVRDGVAFRRQSLARVLELRERVERRPVVRLG